MTVWKIPLAAALALALQACAASVQIVDPARSPTEAAEPSADPVIGYQIHFGPNYQGGFRASLDGQDVTAAFSPPPAPDSTSNATQGAFPAGSGVYRKFGTPYWTHELFVTAECRWYCSDSTAVVHFTPPHLKFSANDIPIKAGGTVTLWVQVDRPPSRPLAVEIATVVGGSDSTGAVALNHQPPGTPITVTIAPGSTSADFSITAGRRRGRFLVTASAPGCQSDGVNGLVKP